MEENNKLKIAISVAAFLLILIAIIIIIILNNKTPKFIMTFETNGGTVIEPVIVKKNGTITKPEDPVKENFNFVGWYYNDELYDFSTPVTSDMTLEARWEALGKVFGVSLDKTDMVLNLGNTYKLIVTITPEDAENKNVTWESSNPSVVSVDEEGNIRALKVGTATITVTTEDGEFTASVTVSVKENDTTTEDDEPAKDNNGKEDEGKEDEDKEDEGKEDTETVVNVIGVSLNTTALNLTEGETSKLTATINPDNANNKNVTWKSSDSSVVSVDANGNLNALKAGSVTITVTTEDGSYTATCTVTVKEKPATYVVTLTPKVQPGTNAIFQYAVTVTKNGSSFSDYKAVIYNGVPVKGGLLQATEYNANITSATIRLNDGTNVTATVK